MFYFEEKKNIRYFQNMFYPTERNENNFFHCKKCNANLPVNFITSDMI